MRSARASLLLGALALGGCAEDSPERASSTASAIIGGEPTDDAATVRIEVRRPPTSTLPARAAHCTGHLVAPGLVLTARHCVLKTSVDGLRCRPDGTPSDPDPPSLDLAPPEWIEVGVGPNVQALQTSTVQKLLAPPALSLCRADFAFLVLTKRDGDTRATYLGRPVAVGDTVAVTGWGYQGNTDVLPVTASKLGAVRVTVVGPGIIPAGMFATPGGTLCPGDSGASARIDGAVAGVFSRAESDDCTLTDSRVLFGATFGYEDFITRAHAEVGDTPRFTAAPAATDNDASTGASPATDAGAAASGGDGPTSGCAAAGAIVPPDAAPVALVFALAVLLRRRVRAGCSCASSAGSCRACL